MEREGGGEGREVMRTGLWRAWAFTWRKMGALGGCEQRRDMDLTQMFTCIL